MSQLDIIGISRVGVLHEELAAAVVKALSIAVENRRFEVILEL